MRHRVAASLLITGALASGMSQASDSLRFEMAGARDGAMPPFTIAVGAIAESNLRNVKVSAAMYADVATAVDRDGTPTLSAQEASFAVTTVRNSTARQVVFMTDRVVGRLIRGIAVKYRSRREPVPAGFEEIANGLPP